MYHYKFLKQVYIPSFHNNHLHYINDNIHPVQYDQLVQLVVEHLNEKYNIHVIEQLFHY